MKFIVFDVEVFPNYVLLVFYDYQKSQHHIFEIEDYTDAIALKNFIISYNEEEYVFVGYNSYNYDLPLIGRILCFAVEDMQFFSEIQAACKNYSDIIISGSKYITYYDHFIERHIDLFRLFHLYNKNRRVSLKKLSFYFREKEIINLPYSPDMFLNEEEKEIVKKYCIHDVSTTINLLKCAIGDTDNPVYKGKNIIAIREKLKNQYEGEGDRMLSFSNSEIGEITIKKFYGKPVPQKGFFCKKMVPKIPKELKKAISPELQNFIDSIPEEMDVSSAYKRTLYLFGNKINFGRGGLHTDTVGKFEGDIIDVDISGYYPASIISYKIYPKHLGLNFLIGYEKIYRERIRLKNLKNKTDEEKALIEIYKEATNCPFGNFNNKSSWMYDPNCFISVTFCGQLALLALLEEAYYMDIKCIMANTDGASFINVTEEKIDKLVEKWKKRIKNNEFVIEKSFYRAMYFEGVNSYIALGNKNKFKGDSFVYHGEVYKDSSFGVIPLSLQKYFVEKIHPAEFIKSHKDMYDFMGRVAENKDFHIIGKHNNGKEVIFNKLLRYYVSSDERNSVFLYKRKKETSFSTANSEIAIHRNYMCTDSNIAPDSFEQMHIDYNFYINKACEVINKITKENVNSTQLSLFK